MKTKKSSEKCYPPLMIPTESSKSQNQVVHEQKFKDLLSSTCQVSPERIVLDLESGVMRGQGSIPTGRNILSLDCFGYHIAKFVMPILALLPILFNCEKTRMRHDQGQIQDSRRRGRNPPRGANKYDFAKISEKLHEIENILGCRGACAGVPPQIRHW